MPVAGGGFEQCYNAQAVVAAGSLLVVATDVVQAANDKQQLEPMVEQAEGFARGTWASPRRCWPTTGISVRPTSTACAAAKIEPLIARGGKRITRRWRAFCRRAGRSAGPNAG